jgi:hypothetical protein
MSVAAGNRMNRPHSMEPTITRKIAWTAVMLMLAGVVAACGGSTQTLPGTAPSFVSPLAGTTDGAGTFSPLKEGKGKGPDKGAPETGAPTTGESPEPGDAGDIGAGHGHGHGNAAIQLEGFTDEIDDGPCPTLTIVINHISVTTELATEFQRTDCQAILDATTPVHLHIAAKMQGDVLVATYVRMQGPKGDDGDDAGEDGTTPTTGTTPK